MKIVPVWGDQRPEDHEGIRPAIHDVSFRPDGSQVAAACGNTIFVYEASGGELLHALRYHTDAVYSVSYNENSTYLASGGADKRVVIWNANTGATITQFYHDVTVRKVLFSPVNPELLLGIGLNEFSICTSPSKRQCGRAKLAQNANATCGAWTSDGQHFAIGMYIGVVSIRDKVGDERCVIKRPHNAVVWCCAWNPVKEEGTGDILCVGSWDQKLSFYHVGGKQVGRDRDLGFDPTCISYYNHGQFILVAGANKKCSLMTRDGVFLLSIHEFPDWAWAVQPRPRAPDQVVCASNDGQIVNVRLQPQTVHSIFQEQYVYRENMTDVVLQLLTVDKRLRIPCRDYVRKVAIYKDRLAVQVQQKIVIYELFTDDQFELRYRVKDKISKKLECNLLCVTAATILLCIDKKITCYDLQGNKRREWVLDSIVRYIKVIGGLAEREVLLVGLRNGGVFKIFIDNAFPVQLIKLNGGVRCLDLNASKNKLSVVEDSHLLQVYQLDSGGPDTQLLFSETGITAVAWNCDHPDMICYTGNGNLYVRTGTLPPYHQRHQGMVVGFKGNKVFTLFGATMSTLDVPHSFALHRCIEQKEFPLAHEIACLGVTEDDWRMLGMQAMTHGSLDISRKAFVRIRDLKYVELLNRVELDRRSAGGDDSFLLGDVLAFQGKYREAAQAYLQRGLDARAIEMYCDLKMWDEAKTVCGNADHLKDLVRRQARWAENVGDVVEAAKLYLAAGDFARAITLMGQRGAVDQLIDICRTLTKADAAAIAECGRFFKEFGNMAFALEAYEKIDAHAEIVNLHVEAGRWQEAFRLIDRVPEQAGDVYVAYAGWLAMNDRYDEAQDAFKKANRPKEAVKMMSQLAQSCTFTRKYEQAAYYYYKLAEDMSTFHAKAAEQLQIAQAERERELEQQQKRTGGGGGGRAPLGGGGAGAAGRVTAPLGAGGAGGGAASVAGGGAASSASPKKSLKGIVKTAMFAAAGESIAKSSADHGLSLESRLTKHVKQAAGYLKTAEYYYAYDFIYSFITMPFSIKEPTMLFHCAQFLMAAMTDSSDIPSEVNKVTVLLALSRLAPQLQMLRLARQVHERFQQFVVSREVADYMDTATLVMRGKPFHDRDDLLIVCPRCGQTSPSLPTAQAGGDRCSNCLLPFQRCWASFVVLPLVEFVLEPGMRDPEAEAILSGMSGTAGSGAAASAAADATTGVPRAGLAGAQAQAQLLQQQQQQQQQQRRGSGTGGGGADVMTFSADEFIDAAIGNAPNALSGDTDPFSRQMLGIEMARLEAAAAAGASGDAGLHRQKYTPITVSAAQLKKLDREDVFVAHRGFGRTNAYYRNMTPRQCAVTMCHGCGKFFRVEDFEFACMKRSGACPFCRTRRDEALSSAARRKRYNRVAAGGGAAAGSVRSGGTNPNTNTGRN